MQVSFGNSTLTLPSTAYPCLFSYPKHIEKELQYREGIIENLIDFDNDDREWKTKLHGTAFEIDSKFIDGL